MQRAITLLLQKCFLPRSDTSPDLSGKGICHFTLKCYFCVSPHPALWDVAEGRDHASLPSAYLVSGPGGAGAKNRTNRWTEFKPEKKGTVRKVEPVSTRSWHELSGRWLTERSQPSFKATPKVRTEKGGDFGDGDGSVPPARPWGTVPPLLPSALSAAPREAS